MKALAAALYAVPALMAEFADSNAPRAWPRAFKLIESAQDHWRMVNAPLVALVCAGATFINGKLVERSGENGGEAEPEAA